MKLYPEDSLRKLGAIRKKCKICGRYFWTFDPNRDICGDHENYKFINNPVGKKLKYYEVWDVFSKFMKKFGYKEINRYPVVARWRDDLHFVIASIAVFQPWVTDGIIKPPDKKVIIPQVSVRFNDIENVGLTGRHFTSFVMIGQHAFVQPEEYNIEEYFLELYSFFESIDLPMKDIVFHEDKWKGGGNAGTCLEFFLYGLEIANQVYMQYKIKDDQWIELNNLKILDMGMGQERLAWITNGTPTAYDVVFPNTINFLLKNIKFEIDENIFSKISSYSSTFDFSEKTIDDFSKFIKEKLGNDYKKEIEAMRAIYSIADHFRTLYIAISDGALPSNIGGNYNLRFIARRAFLFLDKYFENISIKDILKKISEDWYEEKLRKNIDEITDILEYEREKYREIKEKAKKILSGKIVIDSKKLFELYTSYGISPEIIKEFYGDIKIDNEFYMLLERHKEVSKKEKEVEIKDIDLSKFKKTLKAFYRDWRLYFNEGKILGKYDKYYIFDSTVFYPKKGGQINDIGYIFNVSKLKEFSKDILNNLDFPSYVKKLLSKYMIGNKNDLDEFKKYYTKIINVIEYNNIILHEFENEIEYEDGDNILQIIDIDRRYRASRHHTATHILTGVLRMIYGNHIWQFGAEKDENEGRLDVTHHRLPTLDEIETIETLANYFVFKNIKMSKIYLDRDVAERIFGFSIYQGGFIPDKRLRIVIIPGLDAEACSGTHLNSTLEVGGIKITKVEKIADGIIRFRFVAGDRVIDEFENLYRKVKEIEEKLGISIDRVYDHIVKIDRERNELNKKLNYLLDYLIRNMIKDRKIYGKLDLELNDVIRYLIKYQNDIDEINLELKDSIINNKEGDKKIGKFYVKFKS